MIHAARIRLLNDAPMRPGRYVLYWMQQSQRATWNHALEHAIRKAEAARLPVVVGFGLAEHYPEANLRHFAFLIHGLCQTARDLRMRGMPLIARIGDPPEVALDLAQDAALVVADRGYLRHQRAWREDLARRCPCRVVQVESDAVVPADAASDRQEWSAATFRPRIRRLLEEHLAPLAQTTPSRDALDLSLQGVSLDEPMEVLERLRIDRSVAPQGVWVGGPYEAARVLEQFLCGSLSRYVDHRSDPIADASSHLGPYLHFGHISPLEVALRVRSSGAPAQAIDAFLEQLVVRRELSINLVLHNPAYDRYEGLPEWARRTLAVHADDPRTAVYSPEQFERCQTHEPVWNAAMTEIRETGFLHNHLRMYWGKKILEWSRTPEEGFATALRLNNRYFLDGRDPNSYAGVAWCFGTHDRPWPERSVYGTVRCMMEAGLKRKFDVEAYCKRWQP